MSSEAAPHLLALDCCSLVHAKAMSALSFAPLMLIGQLAERGWSLMTTAKVRGELGASSLEQTLQHWARTGHLEVENPTRQEVNVLNKHTNHLRKIPGKNDTALVALALKRGAALLTHDAAAAALALRAGVIVLDLADLAGLACDEGLASVEALDAAWGTLEGYPWPWPDYPWGVGCARRLRGAAHPDARSPGRDEVSMILQRAWALCRIVTTRAARVNLGARLSERRQARLGLVSCCLSSKPCHFASILAGFAGAPLFIQPLAPAAIVASALHAWVRLRPNNLPLAGGSAPALGPFMCGHMP